MEQLQKDIKKIADLLKNSSYAVALTGSGVSDEEGTANFRSPGSGMWTMLDPDDFTIQRFKENPNAFYEIGTPFFSALEKTEPGKAHKVLADLEKQGLIKTIITKNVDGLHQQAGSKNVLEIYGTLRSATCTQCELQVETSKLTDELDKGHLPRCPECGEPLKPDVALFGEELPDDYDKAKKEINKADLVLVIGAMIVTSPTRDLLANNENLVIINATSTTHDNIAKIVIKDNPDDVMQILLDNLNRST